MTFTIPVLALTVIATLLSLLLGVVGVVLIVFAGICLLFNAAWRRGFSSDTVYAILFGAAGVSCLIAIPILFGALT